MAALDPPPSRVGTDATPGGVTRGQVPGSSFTGEYPQRIDGKGRVSIPSDFRRVLEQNDPDWREGLPARLYLLYGDHLKDRLEAYSVAAFDAVAARLQALRPRTPEESLAKKLRLRMVLGQSVRLDVDKDGRVVMPAAQRRKLGLSEGEVVFSGAGDHFEVWAQATYEDSVQAELKAFLDAHPEGFDPMAFDGDGP